VGNRHSPTVIAAAITSQRDKNHLPTHIEVQADKCGLAKDSIVLLEQIRTIDKRRLKKRITTLATDEIAALQNVLRQMFCE
jgi:mRNA interferase MazF